MKFSTLFRIFLAGSAAVAAQAAEEPQPVVINSPSELVAALGGRLPTYYAENNTWAPLPGVISPNGTIITTEGPISPSVIDPVTVTTFLSAINLILSAIDPRCFNYNDAKAKAWQDIVQKSRETWPDWSVAVGQDLEVIEGCEMIQGDFHICAKTHRYEVIWGRYDKKCWLKRTGDGGYTNWCFVGDWTQGKLLYDIWTGY